MGFCVRTLLSIADRLGADVKAVVLSVDLSLDNQSGVERCSVMSASLLDGRHALFSRSCPNLVPVQGIRSA